MSYKCAVLKFIRNPPQKAGSLKVESMDIIAKLEKYRLENKIPQQEVAIKLGVAFSTVNRWLNRKAKPNKIQSYHIEKLIKSKQ